MRITMEFEVPAAVALQIAQLAATHTAEPIRSPTDPVSRRSTPSPQGPPRPSRRWPMTTGSHYGWTPEKLLRYYAEINDPQRGLLDYLAANPGNGSARRSSPTMSPRSTPPSPSRASSAA